MMLMNIKDFEYYVDSKVLERGKALLDKDCIHLKFHYGLRWVFEVKGSKLYNVVIRLRKNGIIQQETCSCHYAQVHICKHLVACLLYVRQELGIFKETRLSAFLKKNPELVEQKEYIKISKKFMQSIFTKIRKNGYISYNNMPQFVIAIDELLEYFESNREILKDKQLSLNLCLFLINTISKTKYNCDDSNGEIASSFYLVTDFIEKCLLEQNTTLFSIIYNEIDNSKNEYDFELGKLLELASQFAQTEIDKQKFKFLADTTNCKEYYLKILKKYL